MGSGFSKMKKQAKMLQQQFAELQNVVIEGSAGNGLVRVALTGDKDLKAITIAPECMSDVEGLQDLIVAAFQDAEQKIKALQPQVPFL